MRTPAAPSCDPCHPTSHSGDHQPARQLCVLQRPAADTAGRGRPPSHVLGSGPTQIAPLRRLAVVVCEFSRRAGGSCKGCEPATHRVGQGAISFGSRHVIGAGNGAGVCVWRTKPTREKHAAHSLGEASAIGELRLVITRKTLFVVGGTCPLGDAVRAGAAGQQRFERRGWSLLGACVMFEGH